MLAGKAQIHWIIEVPHARYSNHLARHRNAETALHGRQRREHNAHRSDGFRQSLLSGMRHALPKGPFALRQNVGRFALARHLRDRSTSRQEVLLRRGLLRKGILRNGCPEWLLGGPSDWMDCSLTSR